MINFPQIDPVIFYIGSFPIKWYSLAYVFGIIFGIYYAKKIIKIFPNRITEKNLDDFVTWSIIGIVLGGRLGYVLFYDPIKYLSHPIDILKTYEGGMSFHGGMVGLILAIYLFAKKNKINFINFLDLIAIVAPIGLFLGRMANFINAELYGRITDVPWAVIFPGSDLQPRHPSQLYEALGEGIFLFLIMYYCAFKNSSLNRRGETAAFFLIFYSILRMFIENYREPDFHIGFIYTNFTMGQLLSLPMFLIGVYLMIKSKWHFNLISDK